MESPCGFEHISISVYLTAIPGAIKTIDNDSGNSIGIGNSIVISIVEDTEHTARTVAQSGGRAKRGLSGAG